MFCKRKGLDRRTCDHIIALFEKSNPQENDRGYYGVYPEFSEPKYMFLADILRRCMQEYARKNRFLNPEYNQNVYYTTWGLAPQFHIQKYNPGDFYGSKVGKAPKMGKDPEKIDFKTTLEAGLSEHCEHGRSEHDSLRILAWMVYLNDIKKDGGTCWPQQNFTAKPRAGDIYIWPAAWTHSHFGIPAPEETKYILTGWCVWA